MTNVNINKKDLIQEKAELTTRTLKIKNEELAELFRRIRTPKVFIKFDIPPNNLDADDFMFVNTFCKENKISEGYGNHLLLARFLSEYKLKRTK